MIKKSAMKKNQALIYKYNKMDLENIINEKHHRVI